jgi:hypothetical protein
VFSDPKTLKAVIDEQTTFVATLVSVRMLLTAADPWNTKRRLTEFQDATRFNQFTWQKRSAEMRVLASEAARALGRTRRCMGGLAVAWRTGGGWVDPAADGGPAGMGGPGAA